MNNSSDEISEEIAGAEGDAPQSASASSSASSKDTFRDQKDFFLREREKFAVDSSSSSSSRAARGGSIVARTSVSAKGAATRPGRGRALPKLGQQGRGKAARRQGAAPREAHDPRPPTPDS